MLGGDHRRGAGQADRRAPAGHHRTGGRRRAAGPDQPGRSGSRDEPASVSAFPTSSGPVSGEWGQGPAL